MIMLTFFYSSILFFAIAIIFYGIDRLFLWMERRGWLYYRHSNPSGTSGVGNALHELHSIFDSEVKSEEEIREELQQEAPSSGDELDEEKTDWIENYKDINK